MSTVLYEYFRVNEKYFKIPITATINTKIECDNCGINSFNNEYPGIYDIGGEWDNSTITVASYRGATSFSVRFGNYTFANDKYFTLGQRYNFSLSKDKFSYGVNEFNVNATSLGTSTYPYLILGGRNRPDSVVFLLDGWLGDFRIYENGVLVMELKPAIKDGDYCYYDTVGGDYYYAQGNGTIEAINQLHVFTSDKQSLRFEASGGTGTIEITAETGWTCTTPTAFTFSTTSGVSGTTSITVTAPANTGSTKIEETITFTDDDNYTFNVKLRQKVEGVGYSYLQIGEDTIDTFYIGDVQVEALYMGDEQIFSV